jgi:peptidoglycan/LPS O-acetylase OafA/YrhL
MTGGVLSGLLTGDRQYLNFLIVMLALYAFSPILRVFTRSAQPRELRYMVIFGLVVCSLYPFMNLQAGFTRPLYYALLGIGYLCVYAAGWYFRSSLMTRRQLRVIYLLGGICLILSLRGIWTGTTLFTSDPTMMIVAPDAILIAAALFLVVKNTLSGMRLSGRVLKPIAALARLSFGIYLIHPILLAVICYALNTFGIVLPTGAFVLLTSIVLIVVSALITWLLKKIPKVGAYIV